MPKERIVNFIDKCAFFFFIILAFFLPVSNAIVESSAAFIFLMFIIRIFLKKPDRQKFKKFFENKINLYLLLFYIAIGLSIFVRGPLWTNSLKAWATKWGQGILLFYCARTFLTKKRIRIILLIMIASACLLSIDGIYQKIAGIDFIRGRTLKITSCGYRAATGTFGHYNDFAAYLGVLLFVAFGFLSQAKKNWQKLFLFLIFLLVFANIILTLSRGAWISLLIVCLFLAIFPGGKKNRLFFLLFLAGFICLIFGIPVVRDRFSTIIQKGGDADRFRVWKAALLMFMKSPLLGRGIGSFMGLIRNYYLGIELQYAHNCYLQILAETGLLGFIPFMWFLGEIVHKGFRKLKQKYDGLFFGLFFGLLVFLTHSFFDTQFFTVKLSILFWLLTSFVTIYLPQSGCREA